MAHVDANDDFDLEADLAPYRAPVPVPPPRAPPLPPLPPGPPPPLPPADTWRPPPAPAPAPALSPDEGGPRTVTVALVRQVDLPAGARTYEVWMTRYGGRPWVFPSIDLGRHGHNVADAVAHVVARQRRCMDPAAFRDAEAVAGGRGRGPRRPAPAFCHEVQDTVFVVHALRPVAWPAPGHAGAGGLRVQPLPVEGAWVCETELATHELVGPPSAYGCPVAPWALEQWESLPLRCRFASDHPPLVLYHGTEEGFLAGIARSGLRPGPASAHAMLGPGVYMARFDKGLSFARHDVDNRGRHTPGVLLRVLLVTAPMTGSLTGGAVRVLTAADVCACGCGRAFVDHTGARATERTATGRVTAVAVPDNAGSATRRAEWCVKDVRRLCILGCFAESTCAGGGL
jgi:hypothetical protein